MAGQFSFLPYSPNFIGIGIASFIPAYLVNSYEQDKKWVAISVVIFCSMTFHGNVNYIFLDPIGLIRFVLRTLFYGELGSIGLFLEIVLMPILWLFAFKRITRTRQLKAGHATVG